MQAILVVSVSKQSACYFFCYIKVLVLKKHLCPSPGTKAFSRERPCPTIYKNPFCLELFSCPTISIKAGTCPLNKQIRPNVRCMKKQSHARYYQNLLHRYLGFKPKLTVLSTRDSDFLYHRETIQQPTLPTSLEQGSVERCHLGVQSRFDEDSRRKHLVHL